MEEEKKEPEKKEEEKPLVLPPVPEKQDKDPSKLEEILENNVVITPDEIGGTITIPF